MKANRKLCKSLLIGIVSLVTISTGTNATENTLTDTQLHATLGIVTNFILDDSIVHNGTSYGTVTSPYTRRVWLDRNLGAKRVCTSFDDAQCYGDYYQWGRNFDGHQESGSDVTNVVTNNDENVGHGDFIRGSPDWISNMGSVGRRGIKWFKHDGTSVCPVGFRVATKNEFRRELFLTSSARINLDSTQKDGNSDDKRLNAFNSFLKLPSSGFRRYDTGDFLSLGESGILFSVSVFHGFRAYGIKYSNLFASNSLNLFARGLPIRCIKIPKH